MKTEVVTCFSDFVEKLTAGSSAERIFRGVPDVTHQLVPPIGRGPRWKGMGRVRLAREELAMRKRFSEEGAAHVAAPLGVSDWMVLGHEHGLPGRLLAWSRSPLFALWFACQGRADTAGAVYVENVSRKLREAGAGKGAVARHVEMLVPKFDHVALRTGVSRQNVYTVHSDPCAAHDSRSLVCLQISGKLKRHLKFTLRQLGVDPAAVVPGLDGVARSIAA